MALVGDLKDLALVDIIQINCVGRNTARLTVNYPTGEWVFYFQDGEIVDARLGNLVGIDAVYRALTMEEGSFRIDAGMTSPTRTIFEQWASILMEGMRLLDEARNSGAAVSQTQYQALVKSDWATVGQEIFGAAIERALATLLLHLKLERQLPRLHGRVEAILADRDGPSPGAR